MTILNNKFKPEHFKSYFMPEKVCNNVLVAHKWKVAASAEASTISLSVLLHKGRCT